MDKLIKGDHAEKNNVIPFANTFNHISPLNLEEGKRNFMTDIEFNK